MQIDTISLKMSGLGKIVLFYSKCLRVEGAIRRVAERLIGELMSHYTLESSFWSSSHHFPLYLCPQKLGRVQSSNALRLTVIVTLRRQATIQMFLLNLSLKAKVWILNLKEVEMIVGTLAFLKQFKLDSRSLQETRLELVEEMLVIKLGWLIIRDWTSSRRIWKLNVRWRRRRAKEVSKMIATL